MPPKCILPALSSPPSAKFQAPLGQLVERNSSTIQPIGLRLFSLENCFKSPLFSTKYVGSLITDISSKEKKQGILLMNLNCESIPFILACLNKLEK